KDDRVSRIHSILEVEPDGQLSIVDMGSLEGTYLNGQRVTRARLVFGDVVALGGTRIQVASATERAAVSLAHGAARAEEPLEGDCPAVSLPVGLAKAVDLRIEQAAPPPKRRGPGPLGAAVHFSWGRQRVGSFFLQPAPQSSLKVGTAPGVDFVLDEPRLSS